MLIFAIRTAALPLTWQALWVGKKKKEINNDYFSGRKSSNVYHCILEVDLDFGNLERFTICTSAAK